MSAPLTKRVSTSELSRWAIGRLSQAKALREFLTTGNSTVQLAARPDMRGRMTALWSTALVGSTPIGATVIGVVGDSAPRLALGLGAAACVAAAGLAALVVRRAPRTTAADNHA